MVSHRYHNSSGNGKISQIQSHDRISERHDAEGCYSCGVEAPGNDKCVVVRRSTCQLLSDAAGSDELNRATCEADVQRIWLLPRVTYQQRVDVWTFEVRQRSCFGLLGICQAMKQFESHF